VAHVVVREQPHPDQEGGPHGLRDRRETALVLVPDGDPQRPERVQQVVDLAQRRLEALVQLGAVVGGSGPDEVSDQRRDGSPGHPSMMKVIASFVHR